MMAVEQVQETQEIKEVQQIPQLRPEQALQNLIIFAERGIQKGLFQSLQEAIIISNSINVLQETIK